MISVLVLVQGYPDLDGSKNMMYVHMRNLYYVENDIDVTVLNFSNQHDYIVNGIQVISLKSYCKSQKNFDILILHAANIRNHYRFLKKYGHKFPKFIFFYHGHEVMKINQEYSKPYEYVKRNKFKIIGQNIYDDFKLILWKYYLMKNIDKSYFIFVSKWMREVFLNNTKLDPQLIDKKYSVIYNSVGKVFENAMYDDSSYKKYDFITIRSNLDGSKYAIDLINQFAKNSPHCKFLVIGKGVFFDYYERSENIDWLNRTMTHEEIIQALQSARFALMPTRTDAQGVMMCEMAAFGIPVITSDIPICHEIFDGFNNVFFINNDNVNQVLDEYKKIESKRKKDTRFSAEHTMNYEIKILMSFEEDLKC